MLSHRRWLILCVVVIIVLFNRFPKTSAPLAVDLGYARYQGFRNTTSGTTVFYGLNYAAPPTGNLRWQSPAAIEQAGLYKDSPLVDASTPGPICHQSKPTWQKFKSGNQQHGLKSRSAEPVIKSKRPKQSEDCLKLDVILPTHPAAASLPVVVFIHGGGFVKGYAAQYDGTNFVAFSRGSVIWVQIQYRLGLFGFLGGSEIDPNGTPNAGLLDQKLALQWVQNHISKFGGDPKRVTIWGGSAGGASVVSQMVLHSGPNEPPFRAAIAEYPWWQPLHSREVLDVQYQDLLTATACSSLTCLRGLDEKTLANAQQEVYDRGWESEQYGYGDFYFGPSVDGKVVPYLPHASLEQGKFANVPLLLDHAGFEGFYFTNKFIHQHFVIQTYLKRLWLSATGEFFSELLKLYPDERFEQGYFNSTLFNYFTSLDPLVEDNAAFYRAQTIFADATINCPTRSIARALTKAGQNVWKMHFNAGTQLHATITKDFLLSAQSDRMSSQLRSYFLAFITALNPNAPSQTSRPTWSPYSQDDTVLVVTDKAISSASDADSGEICDFFAAKHDMVSN